jgi:hypothetical protein
MDRPFCVLIGEKKDSPQRRRGRREEKEKEKEKEWLGFWFAVDSCWDRHSCLSEFVVDILVCLNFYLPTDLPPAIHFPFYVLKTIKTNRDRQEDPSHKMDSSAFSASLR